MKDFRTHFKALADTKSIRPHHVVQYAILRSMTGMCGVKHSSQATAEYLIRRAFTPVRNKKRLESGHEPHQALQFAIREAYVTKWTEGVMQSWHSVLDQPIPDIFDTDAEFEKYKTILKALHTKWIIDVKTRYSRQYVYIFVRQDISPEYQLVQAAHVAARMGYHQGITAKRPEAFADLYFTVIGVPGELALMKAEEELKARGDTAYVFREPDIGDQITAVASSPIIMAERKGLLAYKKLVFT